MVKFEQEAVRFLNLPSIPKKHWDGRSSFKVGITIVSLYDDTKAYAVASYDKEKDSEPKITHVFSIEPFFSVEWDKTTVVPDYMNTGDVESWDLDEDSKRAACNLAKEAAELEARDAVAEDVSLPQSEYSFDFISNDEQGQAYIKDYNKRYGIKGRVPTNHEAIVLRLASIYAAEISNKEKKKQ